ncbi:MAG TPA: hypothetical protein VH134_15250 [Candidatus Dormibacteraeota bacterium]|nr:hypothetical protein [Candidatus Dormibacteraeota bacterium]
MHLPATPSRSLLRPLAAALVLCIVLGAWLSTGLVARAATTAHYPTEGVGNDISFPQCGHDYPGDPAFGIVGITGGRAFTGNPCYRSEFGWARDAGKHASVYLNINYARPEYQSFSAHALQGPAGTCAPAQNPCTAYNYGWNAAADAVARARDAGTEPAMWWLDVETANYWADSPNLALNAQVIQAALDMLRSRELSAGVYSINEMWARIPGRDYRPGVPVWYAETNPATGRGSAAHYCDPGYAFTGGAVWLVQWSDSVDHDYACRANPPAEPPAPSPNCLPTPIKLCLIQSTPLPPAPKLKR